MHHAQNVKGENIFNTKEIIPNSSVLLKYDMYSNVLEKKQVGKMEFIDLVENILTSIIEQFLDNWRTFLQGEIPPVYAIKFENGDTKENYLWLW